VVAAAADVEQLAPAREAGVFVLRGDMDNLTPPPMPWPTRGKPSVHERLVAREVLAISPDGRRKVLVAATDERVGVWLCRASGDGPMATVWLDDDGVAFGLYDSSLPEGPAPMAMGLDPDGTPFLQMVGPGGEVLRLDAGKLGRLLALLGEGG
jgi:hypothetical protein